jgi:flagellar motor switch protein FliN/FliY
VPQTTNGADNVHAERAEADVNDSPAAEPDPPGNAPAEGPAGEGAADGGVHRLHPEHARMAHGERGDGGWPNLQRMLDVPLALTVQLGGAEMPLSDVLHLDSGSVITLDRMPGEPIDLLVNGRVFARGEIVVVDETFGFRITELVQEARGGIESTGEAG